MLFFCKRCVREFEDVCGFNTPLEKWLSSLIDLDNERLLYLFLTSSFLPWIQKPPQCIQLIANQPFINLRFNFRARREMGRRGAVWRAPNATQSNFKFKTPLVSCWYGSLHKQRDGSETKQTVFEILRACWQEDWTWTKIEGCLL